MHCWLELGFLHKGVSQSVSHFKPTIHPSIYQSTLCFSFSSSLPCPLSLALALTCPSPPLELESPFNYYCHALTFFFFCPPFRQVGWVAPFHFISLLFQRFFFQFISLLPSSSPLTTTLFSVAFVSLPPPPLPLHSLTPHHFPSSFLS